MGVIKTLRSQLVTLDVAANAPGTQFNFPDQPQINRDGMVIDAIEVFCADDVTKTPSGIAVITAAQMKTAFLTLYIDQPADSSQGQGEQYNQMPFTSLHRVSSGTNPYVRDLWGFPGTRIDWSKSKVYVSQSLGNIAAVSFLLQVWYHKEAMKRK